MATWKCPFCGQNATLVDYRNITTNTFNFNDKNKYGAQMVRLTSKTCPNEDCKEYTLEASLHDVNAQGYYTIEPKKTWNLIPASSAQVFPEYVPKAVKNDYEEACLIRDLSPKASATLARRCLQGIIRDYWQISKPRLIDEIEAIKDKVDPLTWQAIDAVRHVGNIGAHMEKDINLIIDVEPQEAGMLIGLIELLIKDWYITRHERQEQLRAVVKLAASKKVVKTQAGKP